MIDDRKDVPEKIFRHCIECGTPFEVYPVYRGRPSQWFCTDDCERKHLDKCTKFKLTIPGGWNVQLRSTDDEISKIKDRMYEIGHKEGSDQGYLNGFKDAIEWMIDTYWSD